MDTNRTQTKSTDMSSEVQPPLPDGWDRCHAYNSLKRRYCRQHPLPNVCYCGNHQERIPILIQDMKDNKPQNDYSNAITGDTKQTSNRERIPCPVDPSHTIYANNVEQHVKKCPAAVRQRKQQSVSYYRQDINTGGSGNLGLNENDETVDNRLEWAQRLALAVLWAYEALFILPTKNNSPLSTCLTEKEATKSIPQLIKLQQIQDALPMLDFSASEFDARISQALYDHRIKAGGHHQTYQYASIVGLLRKMKVLPNFNDKHIGCNTRTNNSDNASTKGTDHNATKKDNPSLLFLELGAGRGMTGLIAAGVAASKTDSTPTKLVLVERAGSRGKAETVLRNVGKQQEKKLERLRSDQSNKKHNTGNNDMANHNRYLQLDTLQWSRVQCDLAHVHMPTLLQETVSTTGISPSVTILAKHLCGAGTDLALKSIEVLLQDEVFKCQIEGCIFTTCCHGVCQWKHYVGREYLRQVIIQHLGVENGQFGEAEFQLLARWSTSTVNDDSAKCCKSTLSALHKPTVFDTSDGTEVDDEHTNHADFAADKTEDSDKASTIVGTLNLECGINGLGRACQRLIDYGRLMYMRQSLFPAKEVELVRYVPHTITPQNAALVASNTPITLC